MSLPYACPECGECGEHARCGHRRSEHAPNWCSVLACDCRGYTHG